MGVLVAIEKAQGKGSAVLECTLLRGAGAATESDAGPRVPFPRQLLQGGRRSKTARKERCARATFSGGRP